MRATVAFKPYYIVHAYSPLRRKLVPQYNPNELFNGKELMSLREAKKRSIAFAQSLNESKHYNTQDWVPKIQFVSDGNKLLLDPSSAKAMD